MNSSKKSFINFVPTGMVPTKSMTAYVPETVEEIVTDVLAAKNLGAAIAHLHARDKEGKPTYDKEIYRDIISGIREGEDKKTGKMILCVSTSGRNWPEFEKRSACLDLEGIAKPDMGSLTLGSLNFATQASVNPPRMVQMLAEKMLERGIKPELEIFDAGMINYAHYLIKKKILKPPYYFNVLFGNINSMQISPLSLGHTTALLPTNSVYAVAGLGSQQLDSNVMGLVSGGGIRLGIEDNIWYDRNKTELATNSKLLLRIRTIAHNLEMDFMTANEMRVRLDMKIVEENVEKLVHKA